MSHRIIYFRALIISLFPDFDWNHYSTSNRCYSGAIKKKALNENLTQPTDHLLLADIPKVLARRLLSSGFVACEYHLHGELDHQSYSVGVREWGAISPVFDVLPAALLLPQLCNEFLCHWHKYVHLLSFVYYLTCTIGAIVYRLWRIARASTHQQLSILFYQRPLPYPYLVAAHSQTLVILPDLPAISADPLLFNASHCYCCRVSLTTIYIYMLIRHTTSRSRFWMNMYYTLRSSNKCLKDNQNDADAGRWSRPLPVRSSTEQLQTHRRWQQ